jgi:hypothetical protein
MAQENVGININVQSNADKTLGSLKQQLREATAEVQALSDKFGATSEQAITAAKRASELKDQIGDAKSLVDAFNPDAKFKALTASLSGVAGGFAAAQGAIALFGVESKEVEKALLQVQSAMALSQGLQAVGESIDSFKQLGAVIANSTIFLKANEMANKATAFAMRLFGVSVEATSVSFKVLKGAIAATGLGLLVVAIGEIVAAFQNYSSAAEKAAEKQKQLNETITKGAKTALKAEQDFLVNQEKLDIARAKSRGASEKEIFDIEQSFRKRKAEAQIRFWKEAKNADVEGAQSAAAEVEKINTEAQVALLDFQTKQAAARRAAEKAEAEKRKAEREKLEKEIEEENQRRNEAEVKFFFDRLKAIDALNAQRAKEKAEQDALDKELLDKATKDAEDYADKEFQLVQTSIKNDRLAKDAKAKIAKEESDAKIAALDATSNAITNLSLIAGKETVAGKALAIAASIINTYKGITTALSSAPPPFNFISAAAVGAAGFAAVKNIVSVKVPGAGGGGASVPSFNAQAPIAPPQPQAQTTSLDNRTINAIGNQAVRAYVIENDVTSNQQRIAAIRQRARFG